MEGTATALELRVRTVLLPVLGPAADGSAIGPDTDLWGAGLDSLGAVSLMAGLEDEFGIEFPDALLTRETFSTVNRILDAVGSLEAS
ncbi:phosphopantetheine-binding protein [Streptomyces sp. NBC_01012]|uniref:phosphopantetheine-binding protein n=1 Tax=Streptomyces sp. NBC_01012 TaxID=2903717 RepID=UPI00386E59FE|nr:phosphopantetheine-binding protein [Streptomyces sp. NBC_01012]